MTCDDPRAALTAEGTTPSAGKAQQGQQPQPTQPPETAAATRGENESWEFPEEAGCVALSAHS